MIIEIMWGQIAVYVYVTAFYKQLYSAGYI